MKKIGRILSAACVAVAAASSAYVSAAPAVAATPVSPAPVTAPAQPNLQAIAQGGITRPQVKYTTIISRTDGLITVPEAQLPPASNVTNIVTQDVCPLDFADHVTAVYDDITLRLVSNALDPATAKPPVCHLVLPLVNQAPTQPTAAPAVQTS